VQSARARARARQGFIEEASHLSPHPIAGICRVPAAAKKIRRPPRLTFPLIVKSLNEDASWGISQASVVDSDEKLAERVAFIHESIGTAAIAEQYIEGRELYVGILGNERLRVFPIWELEFGNMPQGARLIATEKVKHDLQYQERHNIAVGPAKDLSPQLVESIKRAAKRIYRTLDLDGYARIDFPPLRPGRPLLHRRPIPTPRSHAAKSSPRPPSTTGSTIPN